MQKMTNSVILEDYSSAVMTVIESAKNKIVFAAPYIKVPVINKIMKKIPESVNEFVCITQWKPRDIASGACDIEIYDEIMSKQGGKLFVNPLLHAKYYSNEESALIGSANLTSRGLGMCANKNFEILVNLSKNFPNLDNWEEQLFINSIPVTIELRNSIYQESLSIRQNFENSQIQEIETVEEKFFENWLPTCNAPDRLWDVYSEKVSEGEMVLNTYNTATEDLKMLPIPKELNRAQFEEYIRIILNQMPIVIEITKLAKKREGLPNDIAQDIILKYTNIYSFDSDPKQSWKILRNWLLHFFPTTYRTEDREPVFLVGRVYE